jgi:hypothetical protein
VILGARITITGGATPAAPAARAGTDEEEEEEVEDIIIMLLLLSRPMYTCNPVGPTAVVLFPLAAAPHQTRSYKTPGSLNCSEVLVFSSNLSAEINNRFKEEVHLGPPWF